MRSDFGTRRSGEPTKPNSIEEAAMKRHFVHLLRAVSPKNAGIVALGAVSALMAFMTIAAAASTVQFKPAQSLLGWKEACDARFERIGPSLPRCW